MNAIVEVATAGAVAKTSEKTIAMVTRVFVNINMGGTPRVATSTKRVTSIAGHSISAVTPDLNFKEELALAGV